KLVDDASRKHKLYECRERGEQGQVLAIPENAVIDTGSLKVVYREASPNTFEGVIVQLGPRMIGPGAGDSNQPAPYYPVISGLKRGERVVTNGSFLIDVVTWL